MYNRNNFQDDIFVRRNNESSLSSDLPSVFNTDSPNFQNNNLQNNRNDMYSETSNNQIPMDSNMNFSDTSYDNNMSRFQNQNMNYSETSPIDTDMMNNQNRMFSDTSYNDNVQGYRNRNQNRNMNRNFNRNRNINRNNQNRNQNMNYSETSPVNTEFMNNQNRMFSDTSVDNTNNVTIGRNLIDSQTSPVDTEMMNNQHLAYSDTSNSNMSQMQPQRSPQQHTFRSKSYIIPRKINDAERAAMTAPLARPLNNVTNNVNWRNLTFYFAQIDMDISWFDRMDKSNSLLFGDMMKYFNIRSSRTPLPVVCDIAKAVDVAEKICKLADISNNPEKPKTININAISSSVEKGKLSYPLFGSVIFALRFKKEPTIKYIGKIGKKDYPRIAKENKTDLVLYDNIDGNEQNKCRAIIFDVSKLEVVDIYLKKFDCAIGGSKALAMLKILATSSNETRFKDKYIKMLQYLNYNPQLNLAEYMKNNK